MNKNNLKKGLQRLSVSKLLLGVAGITWASVSFASVNIETVNITNVNQTWQSTTLSQEAKDNSLLLAQAVTFVGSDPGLARLNNSADSVKFLDWDESDHFDENIDIVAIPKNLMPSSIDGESFIFEYQTGTKVLNFTRSYNQPLVFAQVRTNNGTQPISVQVTSVSPIGAALLIGEPESYDGTHATETIHVVVIEAGQYSLANGQSLQAVLANEAGYVNLSPTADGRDGSVICQMQPLPGCGNNCSIDELAYTPLRYNGLRVTKTTDLALGLVGINTAAMFSQEFTPPAACLVISKSIVEIAGTKLKVNGSFADDNITLTQTGCGNNCSIEELETGATTVTVKIDSNLAGEQVFIYPNITEVEINGNEGDDSVDASALSLTTLINGGNGNDLIRSGTGFTTINGDDGDDILKIHLGNPENKIHCGDGYDAVHLTYLYTAPNIPKCSYIEWTAYNALGRGTYQVGKSITSSNEIYTLRFESDGLVFYQNNAEIWRSTDNGHGNPSTPIQSMEITNDGELLLRNADNIVTWSSGSVNTSTHLAQLTVGDDGELALHITLGPFKQYKSEKIWSIKP